MKPIQQWTAADIIDFLKSVDKKTWIKIAVGAGIAAVLIVFIVWPAWIMRLDIRKQIKTIEGQMKSLETLGPKRAEWLKNKELYLKIIEEAKKRLFIPQETSLLLGQISKKAEDAKISIISSMPKEYDSKFPPPFDQQYDASLYQYSLEGGFHEVGKFLASIESNDKLLQLQTAHILPNEASQKSHSATVLVTAVAIKK